MRHHPVNQQRRTPPAARPPHTAATHDGLRAAQGHHVTPTIHNNDTESPGASGAGAMPSTTTSTTSIAASAPTSPEHAVHTIAHAPLSAVHVALPAEHSTVTADHAALPAEHAPSAEEYAPLAADHAAPTANHPPPDHAPSAEEYVPLADDHPPLVHDHPPLSAEHVAPTAEPVAPTAEHAPLADECVPLADDHSPLAADHAAMTAEHAALTADHAAPTAEPVAPTAEHVRGTFPQIEVPRASNPGVDGPHLAGSAAAAPQATATGGAQGARASVAPAPLTAVHVPPAAEHSTAASTPDAKRQRCVESPGRGDDGAPGGPAAAVAPSGAHVDPQRKAHRAEQRRGPGRPRGAAAQPPDFERAKRKRGPSPQIEVPRGIDGPHHPGSAAAAHATSGAEVVSAPVAHSAALVKVGDTVCRWVRKRSQEAHAATAGCTESRQSTGAIRVVVRVRGGADDDREHGPSALTVTGPQTLTVSRARPSATSRGEELDATAYEYDGVLTPSASQADVFEEVQLLVDAAVRGGTVCVFAYGRRGSGKSHTMFGTADAPGIAPLAAARMFDQIIARKDPGEAHTMLCTVTEVGNGVHRPPESRSYASSNDAIEALMKLGYGRRAKRTHCMVTLRISVKGAPPTGDLCLVDLAGSEGPDPLNGMVNKSLLHLGICVRSQEACWRSDELTNTLEEYFTSGGVPILLLATVSAADKAEHTKATLDFANDALRRGRAWMSGAATEPGQAQADVAVSVSTSSIGGHAELREPCATREQTVHQSTQQRYGGGFRRDQNGHHKNSGFRNVVVQVISSCEPLRRAVLSCGSELEHPAATPAQKQLMEKLKQLIENIDGRDVQATLGLCDISGLLQFGGGGQGVAMEFYVSLMMAAEHGFQDAAECKYVCQCSICRSPCPSPDSSAVFSYLLVPTESQQNGAVPLDFESFGTRTGTCDECKGVVNTSHQFADIKMLVLESPAESHLRAPQKLVIPASHSQTGAELTFGLRCILHHIGSADAGGHYTATIRHHVTDEWLYVDDTRYFKSDIWDDGGTVTRKLQGVAGLAYVREPA